MNMTLLPEIILAFVGILTLMAALNSASKRYVGHIALFGIVLALVTLILPLGHGIDDISRNTLEIQEGISIPYITNTFSILFKTIFLTVGLIIITASLEYMKGKENQALEVYYALILFSILGMMFVASSSDLVTLFLGIELAAIPGFILVAFEKKRTGLEGAVKYFVFGAFFSVIIALGIAFIYMATGSFMIEDIAISKSSDGNTKLVLFLGVLMLLVGFGFEMATVPFHLWAPDAYQGAPSPIAALLAGATKKMAFAATLKVLSVAVVMFKMELTLVIAPLAVFSMVVGNVMALAQKDIRRMLAYSSIAHVGYMLTGIALLTQLGVAASIYHIIVHAFMKAGAFIAAGAVATMFFVTKIEDYKGLAKCAPITAFCMSVFLLSLAGLVPFGGFTSKILILVAAFNEAFATESSISSIALILGVTLIVTSLLSLYYYFRVIRFMYFTEPDKGNEKRVHEPLKFVIPMALAAILTFVLFYAPLFMELCMGIATGLGF